MNIIGKVVKIEFNIDVEKRSGGSYKAWRLVYEDKASGEVKTVAKPITGLRFNAALNNGLKDLKTDDEFTLEMVKDGDFWNPKTVFKGAVQTEAPKSTDSTQPAVKTNSGGGSNWPTSAERQATQVHIIRQNSVTNAVAYINAVGNKKATEDDVIRVAARFEEFIHLGVKVLPGTETMDDLVSDDIDLD